MSRRAKKPGARSGNRGPSTSVQPLSPEEKLSKALELAHEAACLYEDKQFAECCVILQGEMSADLLATLPPKLAFTCRLQFNFSLFYISPINGHLVFDQGTKDRAQDVWLGAWCMPESCFTPQTLLTITETLFAFAIDLTLYDSQRSTLSDVSRIIEHYLILDPREINGYNAVLADKWYSTVKESVPGCYASPSYRETLMGPGMSENDHLLLELLPPNLVVPMLYFAMIRHKDVLDETRYDATQWYGSLVSYCKYNNYPYSRTHSLLAYRIFTGERHYNIRWDIQYQKDILHPHTCGVQLPAEFLNSAQAAFAAVAGGDYTKTAHLFDKCEEILAEKALSLDRFEKLVVASQAGEATKQQLSQRLLDSKHRHLRLVRDIHLNRALFALGIHENDPTADVTPAWEHLKAALAVSPSPDPYSVQLLPLNASTLLNFANSAMALEKYAEAIEILEHLLTVQEDIAVFHRLGDCYLRRFLDLSGDDGRIEAETTFSAWKGKESVSSETLQGLLAKALEAYQETRRRLRSLAGIGVHQIENDNAMVQFREYQEAVFQPEQGGTSSGTTKGKIKKKANKEAETDGQEKNLANELAENYSAMHFTFLEEMYIQTTLSIVYCLLWQRRYEKVLTELLPLRTNRGLSFCSPYALSKSAFLCASLYAGEAKYEMGNGQTASENFDLAGLLSEFTAITSKNTAEDPHRRWRGGLHRETPLPYCTDKMADEDLISNASLLEGLFAYNYLTALVNMGRSERQPGRLARLRPSAITSRGCLALFGKYSSMLDTRLAQLRESLTAGRFDRDATLDETSWSWMLKDIKGRGHRLPDCIPVAGSTTKKSKKKNTQNTSGFQPLTPEEADLVLMASRCFAFSKKRPIPADPEALSVPGPRPETSVVSAAAEGTSRKLLTSGTSTLELIDKFKLARTLAWDAYGYFSSQNYAECYRSLEEEMTGELLDFLPHHDEIDVLMVHNLSHYAISGSKMMQRDFDLVYDRLKNASTENGHWNVGNLLDNETLSAVAEHIYNFAVKLSSSTEGDVDTNIEDAGTLLEQFLWMDLNSLPYFQDAQADGDFVWVHLQAGLPRKTDTFFRVSTLLPEEGQVAWPLVEALDAPLATKMMVWLFIDFHEKIPNPGLAFELYLNLRTYLYYMAYQIPAGLALIQYRLFTGLTFFSITREIEIQQRRFLKIVHIYLELPEDFVIAVFEPFKAYKAKDYDAADRLWLECDRLLVARKEEIDKFETMVTQEEDEALRSSLGDRLIEAKAMYLGVYRDIRLFRAMFALERYQTQRSHVQRAFDFFQEALTVDSGPGPYPATPEPLNLSLPLQFAINAIVLGKYQTAIDILESLLPAHGSKPLVSHRLGDCYLRQYLDLIQDDARIAREMAHWRGDTEEDFPKLPQATLEEANGKLAKALEHYLKAQQLVRAMIEEKAIEAEEKEANETFTKYKQSFLKLRGDTGWGNRLDFNCQAESRKMWEKSQSEEAKSEASKPGNPKKANSKKGKGKNGKRNSGKNTGKWRKDEASTSKQDEVPEEAKVETETSKHQKFGSGSSEDYRAIQHTFLEEMYVQLSINIAYCLLSQRRYQDAVMEASQFHYRTSTERFTLSPYALSPGNYLLSWLYTGIALYERAVGHFDFDSFDYDTVVKEFTLNRQNAPFSVPSFSKWRSYLQGDSVEGLTRLPNCTDGKSTADHGRSLEGVFAYNFLTALANCRRDRRLPYGLARPRPNAIASKGTLKLFANYEKMLEYRWLQLRESIEEGRFQNTEGDAGSAWRLIIEPERAEKIPKCIAEQLARQGEAPLTPEQVNDLEGAMFESYSRGGIPADEENGPPVPAEWEVRELAKEEEKARKKLHSKVELKAEVQCKSQAEAEEQSQESAEELAEESAEETSTQSAKSEALSEESELEEDEVSELELQSENPSIENVQNGAEESKVSNEDDLIQNESLQKALEETVLEEKETEQPAPVVEAIQSETSPTVEVDTHSSFEFLEILENETALERQFTEKEEVIVKSEMVESKWSQLDEQLEMGADEEDEDVNSEGSAIWDSVNQGDDFDDYFAEEEVWDTPHETLENGTFFGLPQVAPSDTELLTTQPELDPYLQPAVKVSSTAKSQSAQAAASELGNLLSKFTLTSTRKSQSPLPETAISSEPTQPQAAPFTFPPPPQLPALVSPPPTLISPVLVDLSANNSSLGPCPSTKPAKEPVYSVPPITTTTLSPSNMFDIGEFNPFPTSNQSLLDRYMREPPTSDCASSKAPTPPLGGFPFGPIGRPASKPADLLDSLLDEAAEEDDDDPSAQYMKLSHHFALMAHHEKEKKAQEEKVQQLLAQMRRQREKRESSQKGAGLAPNPQQLPHLPNWEQPQQQQQPTPNLNQNGRSSMFPSHLPEAPGFVPFQASASSGSLFGHLQPQSANSLLGMSASGNVPTTSSSFGLSIDLNADYFATPPPIRPTVSPNLCNFSAPFGVAPSQQAHPFPPPSGVLAPEKPKVPTGQPSPNATLAELFDAFQTK